jgi:hypothetical protein
MAGGLACRRSWRCDTALVLFAAELRARLRGVVRFAKVRSSQFRAPRVSSFVEKEGALISDKPAFRFLRLDWIAQGSQETSLCAWRKESTNSHMSSRLYVGNLSFNATNDSIREAFGQHGTVTDVHVVMDRETGRSRGFAFVTMGNDSEASAAIAAMNGAMLDGRALRVNEAEERAKRPGGGGDRRGGGGGGRW